jgi:tripartite-type tricarboxylate transporter receptor subunit TctC
MAPAGTPQPILDRLHAELVKAESASDVTAQLHRQGVEAKRGSPDDLSKYIAREYATWGRVVKEAKIQAN